MLADLDVGPRGDAAAAWVQTRPGGYQVRVATRGGRGGWSRPRSLTGWLRARGRSVPCRTPAARRPPSTVAVPRRSRGPGVRRHGARARRHPLRLGSLVAGPVAVPEAQARRQPTPRHLDRGDRPDLATGPAVRRPAAASPGTAPAAAAGERRPASTRSGSSRLGSAEAVVDPGGRALVTWDEERRSLCCAGRVRVATYLPGTGWSVATLFQRSNHSHQSKIDLAHAAR